MATVFGPTMLNANLEREEGRLAADYVTTSILEVKALHYFHSFRGAPLHVNIVTRHKPVTLLLDRWRHYPLIQSLALKR